MKNNVIKNITNKTLGILGGGQLGKMIAVEASRLGIKTCIFDPNKNASAFQNANIIVNSDYTNKKALKQFVKHSDKVTYEFENIPLESLNFLEKNSQIFPGIKALKYSQDRLILIYLIIVIFLPRPTGSIFSTYFLNIFIYSVGLLVGIMNMKTNYKDEEKL